MGIHVGQLRQWTNGNLVLVMGIRPSAFPSGDMLVDLEILHSDALPTGDRRRGTWSEPTVLKESVEVSDGD